MSCSCRVKLKEVIQDNEPSKVHAAHPSFLCNVKWQTLRINVDQTLNMVQGDILGLWRWPVPAKIRDSSSLTL